MRKREYQSFALKLTDLTEYEAVREERAKKKAGDKPTDSTSTLSVQPTKYGPKSKLEVQERIGLKKWNLLKKFKIYWSFLCFWIEVKLKVRIKYKWLIFLHQFEIVF